MNYCLFQKIQNPSGVFLKRLQSRWILGLLVMTLTVGGCASKPPAKPQVVEEPPPVIEEMTITRLEGGRMGFVITEIPDLSATWHPDFEKSVVLMQAQQYGQAIPLLESIIQMSPGVTAPYINLAMAYRRSGQFELAETQLQKALGLVPDHPVAMNEYGLLLRQTGRFDQSRDTYENALQAFPEFLPVRLNLGILCELYLDDPACALEQYTIYGEARPDDEQVQLWMADLHLRLAQN